jgi:hypothetical protein
MPSPTESRLSAPPVARWAGPGGRRGPVAVRTEVTADDLTALAQGLIRAVHLRGYYPAGHAALISQRLIRHPLTGRCPYLPGVGRVGLFYAETVDDPALRERYHAESPRWAQALRDAAAPYQSPLDTLRLQLQERWPGGASVETVDGRPMSVGLARVFDTGAEVPPHQDLLRREVGTGCPRVQSLLTQFAAHVCLRPAASGGELELWSTRPNDDEFEALRLTGGIAVDRAKLPAPEAVLRISAGDAVLFDATRLHAVRPVVGGPLVTLSCYVGYRGPGQPLTYWS